MFADILEALSAIIEQIVLFFGEPGIALVALIENIFPPTPSEFLYPLAGKMAYDGNITLLMVIVAGVFGSAVGSSIYYGLGFRLGESKTRDLIDRFGQIRVGRFSWRFLRVADYDSALELFRSRGGEIVMIARIMPVVHSIVSIPAGVARMNYARFLIFTVLGSLLWITPLTLLGYILGSQWTTVLSWLDVYEYVWYAVILVGVAFLLLRRTRRRHQENVLYAETHQADKAI